MRIKKTILTVIAAAIVITAMAQAAVAHSLWINVTDHQPAFRAKFGAQTKTYIGWGHRQPVQDFLSADTLLEYSLIDPLGRKTAIEPAEKAGFLSAQVQMKKPGAYVVSVVRKPGFYTMYEQDGAIRHFSGPKTGLPNIILSNHFEQYAKSLIAVGDPSEKDFQTPIGHKLEIIPLAHPATLKGNGAHFLPMQILFDGKPARFVQVLATYGGFSTADDYAFATVADGQGIAKIRILQRGTWLIKANLKTPPPENMKELCDGMNYTATMTFEIP
ncbi:MAG: DUF4198 domain-containing protein [Smithellaceae bacterium]